MDPELGKFKAGSGINHSGFTTPLFSKLTYAVMKFLVSYVSEL